MRFLIDVQLPPALAEYLNRFGHEAAHVVDVGLVSSADSSIWDYAMENGYVIVTKDEDFPYRQSQSRNGGPVVVWLRIGNCSRRALLSWFEPLLPRIVALIEKGDWLIEVR